MFASLYNRPICSLFGNTSAPGFSGHCDTLPMTCTDEARWCEAQKGDSAGTQVSLAAVALHSTRPFACRSCHRLVFCASSALWAHEGCSS